MKNKLFNEIIVLLDELNSDECAPRLLKMKIREVYSYLNNDKENVSILIDKSLQELDEISEDCNIPVHIKTQLWDIVSKLESIPQ